MIHTWFAFTTFLTVALAVWERPVDVNACKSLQITGKGSTVNFYKTPLNDQSFKTDPDFNTTGYQKFGFLKTITGVNDINFSSSEGDIYGYRISQSNFSMDITGYFLAPQTGEYHFTMEVDDGAFFWMGAGDSCSGTAIDDVTGQSFKAESLKPMKLIIDLEEGLYYPIKIVCANWHGGAKFDLQYSAPDGTIVKEIASNIYQALKEPTNTKRGDQTDTTELIPEETPNGCNSLKPIGTGAEVSFYKYPYEDMTYNEDPLFYVRTYKYYEYLNTITGVTALNYVYEHTAGSKNPGPTGEIYGYEITPSNFTMVISGYFLAKKTGAYNFTMVAEDGTLLRLGTGGSCSGDASVDAIGNPHVALYKHSKSPTYNLKAGVYYPITFVHVHSYRNGKFDVQYTDPDGTVVTDIGSDLHQAYQEPTNTGTGNETNTMDLAPTDTPINTPNGCDSLEFTGTGADVSFYKYPYGDMSYIKDPSFYSSTYKKFGSLDSTTGVKALNYIYETHCWIL
ncbi:hypothetical protein JCM33374_g6178 [Metschnikowia sp. JCM 33374]|nr:hypothetical protein JCM33374_g6178 [Metschnikowia sp. JCM 33374]